MNLDAFDRQVLESSGNAQDLVKEFYGADISLNNANKRMTGIRMHLKHKQSLPGGEQQASEMEELSIKADGSRTTRRLVLLSEEDKQSPQRIMELMGYDPLQWQLVSCQTRRNYWDVSMKVEGEVEKHTNHAYMVTLNVKPVQQVLTSDIARKLFENMNPPELQEYRYTGGQFLLELPIVDVHYGKLAWGKETGEDYDIDIAADRYRAVIMDMLSTVKEWGIGIEKIIFPIGNDYFHMDTPKNTTTAGTQMDSDTRWQKMYSTGVELLCWAIEQLRSIAPVECMYVPGNHDEMLSYCATVHAQNYFRSTDSVTVDISAPSRKYVKWGKCLIGYSHGKDEGKRIAGLMQIEQPEAWGDTSYREWHLADLHHEESKEENGIVIRRVSAITGTDAWHAQMGFKGAQAKARAFLWDKERGLRAQIDSTC